MIYLKLFMTFMSVAMIAGTITTFIYSKKLEKFCEAAMLFGLVGATITIIVCIWDLL